MDSQRPLTEVDLTDIQDDDIPEESEDMSCSDGAQQAFSPPARIAARFYRPTMARRKSSAASSRRNSLTSNHSQMSNSSYRQACRNNHVAQYLRRASIIESRKNRLAAREAHAEQVRLRAALAKSAPRSSNSEERALAAQQAREVRLAQIAQTCAEEVRKAKKKAEEMKEKRAAEEERYRLEMEEKHAEAERRRLQYQRTLRRPRTTSTPPNAGGLKKPPSPPPSTLDEKTAAQRIQRVWRATRRKRILSAFTALGMSIDQVQSSSYEAVREKLLDDHVLSVTKQVLEMYGLYRVDEAAATGPTSAMALQTPTRNFLTAYLLLGHPTEVLTRDGEQEKDLIQKAKDLILAFEETVSKSTQFNRYQPSSTLLEELQLAHTTYLTAFEAWKAQDSTMLVEIMVATFVHLDAIWQSVKDDNAGGVAEEYRDGIRNNQIQLLVRIKRMVGKERANIMIAKALREARRRGRLRRKPVGDVRPRVAPETSIHPNKADGNESLAVSPEATSHLAPSASEVEDVQNKAFAKLFSVLPDNRVLTHELAIDREYTIEMGPHSDLRDALNRQIIEQMKAGFAQGDGDAWTIAMAQNIRAKLLHLLGPDKPNSPTRMQIMEVLDPDLVAQQCAQGIFSYEKFFNFMAALLPKLCAPVRDEEVKALCEELQHFGSTEEMIEKLAKLLRMIDLFSLDYSNYLLKAVAPRLIQEAPGYEQRRFGEQLVHGEITLRRTKRWWKNAHVNCVTEGDRRNPHNNPTAQKIYARGLVDLAIASTKLKESELPETLQLDRDRIIKIRRDAVRITIIGAILLTAKSLLKRDVRSQWKPEANRLWGLFKDGYTSETEDIASKALSIIESGKPMPATTKTQLLGTISRLLPQAESGRFTDPVVKVLFQRLRTHVFNRLSASSSNERVRAASSAGEGLATSGLPEFIVHVGDIVDLLTRMSDVDRKSHGVWYEQVAAEVEAMADEDGSDLSRETTNSESSAKASPQESGS
ncbi:uncharacterized protein PV09_03751 [Verruconis gallopava]|uniref:Uncharacterized protein n=1 Tax=Verruconis gallopava TaxID=253628 RepID=A0A0D2ADZ7_9PEZI|nr:uncharacterized protein PV09_03751 [Verruconis gallopava]KIW05208.1 hypothetical protein PV09_03751 [Verruconis gallopava]